MKKRTTPLVVLLTDFGHKDPFVGVIKGIIYGINSETHVVDMSHGVQPQHLREAAFLLCNNYRFFPPGSIFVVVVDPGVGSGRRILCAKTPHGYFLVPDNGILGPITERFNTAVVRVVTNRRYFLQEVSATFHGRDIFAPVAAHLSQGNIFHRLGPVVKTFSRLRLPTPKVSRGAIEGEVMGSDSFGNLITNIARDLLPRAAACEHAAVRVKGKVLHGIVSHFQAVPKGGILAYVGSAGYLEIAQNLGSAERTLGARSGDHVTVVMKP